MSLCFRTLPNKLTSFVNTRKQVTQIDRQLPKHIKSSSFLEEFLGTEVKVVTKTNFQQGTSNHPLVCSLPSNLLLARVDSNNEVSKLQNKRYESTEEQIQLQPWQYRARNTNKSSIVNGSSQRRLNRDNIIFENNMSWDALHTKNRGMSKHHATESDSYNMQWLSVNRILHNIPLTSNFKTEKVSLADNVPDMKKAIEKQSEKPSDRSPEEKLQHVYDVLSTDLPRLFVKPLNYEIYSPDIIFINNIRGVTTTNLVGYIKQLAFIKIIGHLRFAYVKLEVLKITMHPEDSTIKVRWRIRGIGGIKVLFMFWKFKLWKMRESLNIADSWYDGFSTFYVNADGLVFKHIADKMMPDEDVCKKETKTPIEAKLALFTALLSLDMYSLKELCLKLGSQLQSPQIK